MSTKEKVKKLKEEREKGERVIREKPFTILELKQKGFLPFDKINPSAFSDEFKDIKAIPYTLTWDEVIEYYNDLLESGPDLTYHSSASEGIQAAFIVLKKLFLE